MRKMDLVDGTWSVFALGAGDMSTLAAGIASAELDTGCLGGGRTFRSRSEAMLAMHIVLESISQYRTSEGSRSLSPSFSRQPKPSRVSMCSWTEWTDGGDWPSRSLRKTV